MQDLKHLHEIGDEMQEPMGKRLRADAVLNHDRVLDAATRAFEREGTGASLKAIAQDAGVGIGTLYRRFPTREQLVWAVYRGEVDRICASTPALLADLSPLEALQAWMASFIEFLTAKRGLPDALKAALAGDETQRVQTRGLITGALATLLDAGAADGTLRPDVDPFDVHLALGGIALIAGEPEQRHQAGRQLDLLMHALRRPTTAA